MIISLKPQLVFALLACMAMLFVLNCRLTDNCSYLVHHGYLRQATSAASGASTVAVFNNITYLYIVGVEGVGHHGIAPAIAKLGEACNHFVVYEHKILRKFQHSKNLAEFHSILEVSKRAGNTSRQVLVVEDASFPSGDTLRHSTYAEKKAVGKYDLEWIYHQITKIRDIDVKFLYLSRDFYRTVASHPEFDGGFEQHAQVILDFIGYINHEYQTINKYDPHIWRQISYEWFTDMKDCPRLVSALVDFIGLGSCNIESACSKLAATIKKVRMKEVNSTDYEYAQQFNTSLSIPFLDYPL